MNKFLNGLLAVGMFLISGYLFLVERLTLPSRYGSMPSVLEPPVTFMMALLPLSFGVAIVLSLVDRERFKKLCGGIVAIGVAAFFIGLVIVAPIVKSQ